MPDQTSGSVDARTIEPWPLYNAEWDRVYAQIEFIDGSRGWYRLGEMQKLTGIKRLLATAVKL